MKKRKQQTKNCPRLQNAIKRVVAIAHRQGGYGWWTPQICRPYGFGTAVWQIAYQADKYDVLNHLIGSNKMIYPCNNTSSNCFIRGDIRHKNARLQAILLLLLLILVLLFTI